MTANSIQNAESIRDSPGIFLAVQREGEDEQELDVSGSIGSLQFIDSEKKADKLTLTVDNFDNRFFDDPVFAKGNILHMRFGFSGLSSPVRELVIKKSVGGSKLNVEAKSKSMLMATDRKCVDFEDISVADVVRQIATENGFGVDAQFIEDSGEAGQVVDVINQPSMTDAQFLKYLAFHRGFEFFVDYDGLHWHPRRFEEAPTRRLVYYGGRNEGVNTILDYSVENDLTAKPAKTTLKGINGKTKREISQTGSNTETDRPVLQEVIEIFDFEEGKFVERTRIASEEVISTAEDTDDKAKARADGRFRKIQQTAVKLNLDLVGDPLLLAKTVVIVEGLGKRLSGRYYVKEVSHKISKGYSMSVKLITDGTRGRRGVSTTDLLFPSDKSTRGAPSTGAIVNVLNGLGQVIREQQARQKFVGSDTSALAIAGKAERLASQLESDPTNTGLYDQASTLGKQAQSLGRSQRNKETIRAGKSVVSTADRGKQRAEVAKAKGQLNKKDVQDDGEKRKLEEVFDPETQTWTLRQKRT